MRAVNSWLSTLENQENRRNETGLSVDFPLRAVELNLPDNFPIKREQTKARFQYAEREESQRS